MSQKTKEEMYGAVQQTMAEITEILAKSGYAMGKAEGDDEFSQPAPEGAPPPEMGAPEGGAPEGAPPPEMGAPEGAPEQGGEQGGDEMEEMRAHAQELSDEELQMMLEILQAEQEQRGAASQEGAPEGAAPAPEGAPAPQGDEFAEKSMKEDYAKMAKSIATIGDAVAKLTKAVESGKAAPAARRPAVTNSTQVLAKSNPAQAQKVQRLSKSDTIEYCLGQQRQGNPLVNRDVISDLTLVRTDEDLHKVQDTLVKQGFKFPES